MKKENTIEDDLVDLKSERKRVKRGKGLRLKRKRVEDDLVDMKSERKHVKRGKRLKLEAKRLKSERKRVERGKALESEPERKHDKDIPVKNIVKKGGWTPISSWNLKEVKISDAEYLRRARHLSPFDAIPRPPISYLGGGVVPFPITNRTRPLLIELSEIALKKYNDDNNKIPPFEFHELVKSTRGSCAGSRFYITFKEKQSSNSSSKIFQAQVWRKLGGSCEVISCAIKE